MKIFIIFSAILAISNAFFAFNFFDVQPNGDRIRNVYNSSEGIYETPLDHFSPTDGRFLRLPYVANVQYFEQNGPLFFYIRHTINSGNYSERGLIVDLAKELKGAVIEGQTRYFGDNLLGNATVDNLRYLTGNHMLADIPHLILKVKQDLKSENSRVIVFGARESGTIAALARKKFPHIVDGVWSSSGIFRAFTPDLEYFNTVARNLRDHGSENCTNALGNALTEIQQLIESRNVDRLRSLFNLCEPANLKTDQDVQLLYSYLIHPIPRAVNGFHLRGIQELCGNVTSNGEPLNLYSKWFRDFSNDSQCVGVNYESIVQFFTNVSSVPRRFLYHECTQLGLNFLVTPEDGWANVFPAILNQTYYSRLCHDIFGDVFNFTLLQASCDNFNIQHGSQNQVISNAIFSNGELDPMLGHGISEYNVTNTLAITTRLTGGAADLDSVSDDDSNELKETKTQLIEMLTFLAITPNTGDEDSDEEGEPHF